MSRKVFELIFIASVLFYSCKKDKDETKPSITINSPVHFQQINGIDTVQVLASIVDNRNIERVHVSLRNSNDVSVLTTVTKNPNTSSYNLNLLYFFDDIHLPSGQYDFAISASDGENTTTSYVTILLNEESVTREGIFVVSNTGSNSDISYLDNTYNGNFYQSIVGDFIGASVNSYDQQLIHVSSVTGGVSSIDLISGVGLWNIPIVTSPPTPFYSGFLYDNQTIFLGKRNGEIQGYDKNGAGNYSASSNLNYFMESAHIHNSTYLVTEQKQVSGGLVRLVLYWLASGGLPAQQTSINEDIKGIFSQTVNKIVLFTNDLSSMGKLIFFDVPSGLTSSPFNLSIGQINDCVEISAGVYLVAEGSNITLINANSFSTLPYLTGVAASKLRYDSITNELFVVNGNVLYVYDYSSKSLKGSYTHTNIIKEVVFWYNK